MCSQSKSVYRSFYLVEESIAVDITCKHPCVSHGHPHPHPTLSFQILLTSLDRMLDTALELDTGRYSPGQSPLILYVFRLVVRVEGFLLFLRDERRCRRTRGLRREDRCGGGVFVCWTGSVGGPEVCCFGKAIKAFFLTLFIVV